jgi:hypothetical protein
MQRNVPRGKTKHAEFIELQYACRTRAILATRASRGDYSASYLKAKCVHALKGLALPRASHSREIALAGSSRLRSTLAAAQVLFAQAVVTEIKIGRIISPS